MSALFDPRDSGPRDDEVARLREEQLLIDLTEELDDDNPVIEVLKKVEAPVLLILNKKDLVADQRAEDVTGWWKKRIKFVDSIAISALKGNESAGLLDKIVGFLLFGGGRTAGTPM